MSWFSRLFRKREYYRFEDKDREASAEIRTERQRTARLKEQLEQERLRLEAQANRMRLEAEIADLQEQLSPEDDEPSSGGSMEDMLMMQLLSRLVPNQPPVQSAPISTTPTAPATEPGDGSPTDAELRTLWTGLPDNVKAMAMKRLGK